MFFFCKQKTAYEMRISDWSSDVCSSDLPGAYTPRSAEEMQRIEQLVRTAVGFDQARGDQVTVVNVHFPSVVDPSGVVAANPLMGFDKNDIMREIGRASCRERVCQYV